MRQTSTRTAAWALALALAVTPSDAKPPQTLDDLVASYLESRGTEIMVAPDYELARRYAMDLTGVLPSAADLAATQGKTPSQMFEHFAGKGPMAHTGGRSPYVWANLLRDSDAFLFSNSTQFSRVEYVREFADQLRRVYQDGWSYRELARWALESQVFLGRFPSAADRANAAFFLFLGRDSLSSEVAVGSMWNGYRLVDADIPAADAETDPDYHVYVYDADRCTSGEVVCQATLWGKTGSTPKEAIDLIVGSAMFAEAVVDRYWLRALGTPLPGVEFPEIRRVLVEGLVAHDFDVNWLIRELMTSAPYVQEMMFR